MTNIWQNLNNPVGLNQLWGNYIHKAYSVLLKMPVRWFYSLFFAENVRTIFPICPRTRFASSLMSAISWVIWKFRWFGKDWAKRLSTPQIHISEASGWQLQFQMLLPIDDTFVLMPWKYYGLLGSHAVKDEGDGCLEDRHEKRCKPANSGSN